MTTTSSSRAAHGQRSRRARCSPPSVAGDGAAAPQAVREAPPLAITRVAVIDVARRAPRWPTRRCSCAARASCGVGPSGRVRVPAGARVVDGRARFLIPGLWDMHVHLSEIPDRYLPLLLAHGVTGARDMHQPLGLDSLRTWRRAIAAGERVGRGSSSPAAGGRARVALAGRGDRAHARGRPARGGLAARAGADFVKVYNLLRPEVYAAIVARAREVGSRWPATRRSSWGSPPPRTRGSAAGAPAARRQPPRVLAARRRAARRRGIAVQRPPAAWTEALAASQDPARCAAFHARLARNGTWGCRRSSTTPRASCRRSRAPLGAVALGADSVRARFDSLTRDAAAGDTVLRANARMRWGLETLPQLRAAGVRLLAGTDCTTARVNVCGPALHDELALLVAHGLTPAEALRAATLDPARFLGAADSLGTVAAAGGRPGAARCRPARRRAPHGARRAPWSPTGALFERDRARRTARAAARP
jgi:hypothetical protein